ncbi:MAG: hypothetical protein MRY79_08360 [Alphaproteobacteria bacterium]|nr:hypothetical protein [Alphaproteobacteria bacterium]
MATHIDHDKGSITFNGVVTGCTDKGDFFQVMVDHGDGESGFEIPKNIYWSHFYLLHRVRCAQFLATHLLRLSMVRTILLSSFS